MGADATVEGSIVGRLRLDITDWEAKLSEAEAKARELGRINPDVRVSAETAEAIAKLRAVEEAAAAAGGDHISHVTTVRSTVGNSGGEDITGSTVATAALAEAIRKLDAASLELDVAQAADEEQMRQTSVQALKESINMEALAAAERKASENAVQLSAAERLAADGANEQAAANGNNVSRMQLIIGAVAALVPMLGPLAGYATGVAGALAGMGAAGVLAILGIKNAMADGTVMGQTYAAGLQVLKGDLSQLEQTAASGILTGFQQAIATIDSDMPELNRQIGLFSNQLGVVGNYVLTGVVTAFRVLNPLFLSAGVYVEQLAQGFASWTQDGGLQKFATMAMQDFPVVVQTVGSLAGAIMNLIGAFEPLGVASLNLLTVLGNVVSFLTTVMGPAFAPVVLGAGAAYLAFKQWQSIGPIIEQVAWKLGALGVAADAAAGPIGWVVGGVGLLVTALTLGISATQESTASMEAYTAALQQDSGVLGENTQKQVAANLQKDGALTAANQLGISTKKVTQATLDGGTAYDQLTSSLKDTVKNGWEMVSTGAEMVNVQTDTGKAAEKLLTSMQKENGGIKDTVASHKQLATATSGMTDAQTAAAAATKAAADQFGVSTADYTKAFAAVQVGAAQAAADIGLSVPAYEDLATKVQLATDAAKRWKAEQDIINGVAQTVEQSNITMSQAYTTMGATVEANIKQVGRATATSMDINTQYGAQNHQMILSMVQDAQASADAQVAADLKAGMSQAQASADGNARLAASKQHILGVATQSGLSQGAVQGLLDEILLTPTSHTTTMSVDDTAALQKLAGLKAVLVDINGALVTVQTYGIDAINAAARAGDTALKNSMQVANSYATGAAYGHSQGGPIYKAAGGAVASAYLALGGSPFQPKGTDTVRAMLTPGEFVTKRASAQAYPGFMQAYNDNPTRALQAVQQSGSSPTYLTVNVTNKTGANLNDLIDMRIESKSGSKRVQLSTGLQQVAF